MSFADYWERLCNRNKALRDQSTKMTITVGSFKKSMQQSYEQGAAQTTKPTTDSLFGKIFGT